LNPLSQALEKLHDELASLLNEQTARQMDPRLIITEEELNLIKVAAGEIAICANSVEASTMLALTMAEKFGDTVRRNDELLQRISDEVEAHRVTKELLAEAMATAERATTMAEGLNAEVQEITSYIKPQPNMENDNE
jgi:hypothetical protein